MSVMPIRTIAHPVRELHRAILDGIIDRLRPELISGYTEGDLASVDIEMAGRRFRITVAETTP